MTDARPVLEVNGLEVRYGAVVAVRDVSLTVASGEVVGLIGPNGAGKSTTLHSIMGAIKPSSGDVRLRERSIVGMRPEDIARLGLALVPEGRRIFSEFTVEENMRLGALARRSSDGLAEDLEWVHSLFPIVAEFKNRQAGYLSGGQQQQLALARALVSRPDLLLLDEPTLGLAPSVVSVLFDALAEIRESGVPILLVEQRAQQAVGFADRTHVMRDGRLTLSLSPEDAGDTEGLTAAYFG